MVAHSVALPRADVSSDPGTGEGGAGDHGSRGEAAASRSDAATPSDTDQGTVDGTGRGTLKGPLRSAVACQVSGPVGTARRVSDAVPVACMDAGAGAVPVAPVAADGFPARLVASWPTLPGPVRAGIRAMVEAAAGQSEAR